jgi:hypothetical protein
LADFLAAVPTLVKSYKAPETESANAYIGGCIGGVITLLTVKNWTMANYAFSLYLSLNMGAIALLVMFPRLRLGWRIGSVDLNPLIEAQPVLDRLESEQGEAPSIEEIEA